MSPLSFFRPGAIAAALLAVVVLQPAAAMTVQTGSYSRAGLGAEFATPYDSFTIDGATISFAAAPSPFEVALGSYSFEVGPNCYACNLAPSFDAFIDITVDGLSRQLDLSYAWSSSGPSDALTFATPAPLLFDFGALGSVQIAVENPGVLSSSGGVVHGNLNALVSVSAVPEPGTVAMMLAGLGAVGFVARRRR